MKIRKGDLVQIKRMALKEIIYCEKKMKIRKGDLVQIFMWKLH